MAGAALATHWGCRLSGRARMRDPMPGIENPEPEIDQTTKKPTLADWLFCLLVLAPRPGLEPGTYGLTVRGGGGFQAARNYRSASIFKGLQEGIRRSDHFGVDQQRTRLNSRDRQLRRQSGVLAAYLHQGWYV